MMADEGEQEEKETPLVSEGPFTLKIPDYGRKLKFDDLAEFHAWATKENDDWQQIGTLGAVVRVGGDDAVTWHHHFFGKLASDIEAARTVEDQAERDNLMARVNDWARMLERGECIPLSGRRGGRFLKLVEEDPVTAVGMLMWNWTERPATQQHTEPQFTTPMLVRAMIKARIAELKGVGLPDAVAVQMSELAEDWDDRAKVHARTIGDAETQIAGVLQAATANTEAAERDAKEMRERHEAEIGRITKNYEERMKLDAPAKYWRTKKWWHLGVAFIAFIAFAVAVGAGIGGMWWKGASIIEILKAGGDTIGLGSIVLVTLPALAYFWFLRLISRIFVTNLHFMADAGLRSTMTTTFLALIEDETNPVEPNERLLVLQALFRPAGESGDDAAPTNLMERIIKGRTPGET